MFLSAIMSDTVLLKPLLWQDLVGETVIHTVQNLYIDSIFALYNCLY